MLRFHSELGLTHLAKFRFAIVFEGASRTHILIIIEVLILQDLLYNNTRFCLNFFYPVYGVLYFVLPPRLAIHKFLYY